MIGRFLCGISAGCYSYILPIYTGEISSNEFRGGLLSLFQGSVNFGVLFVFSLGHFTNFFVLNVTCGSLTILYSICFLLMPESPALLVAHNRENDAKDSLILLNGKHFDAAAQIETLRKQNEVKKKTFVEVFKTKATMKAFVIIMFQFFFFQMCGINVILFYSTTIFIEAGINLEAGIASIVVACFQVTSTLLSLVFVDRFGRKIMLCLSNGIMTLGMVGIGTYFAIRDAGNSVDLLKWLPLTSLCIFVIAFAAGMGPVSFILLGEIFQHDAKQFVAPIGQTLNLFLTFVIGLTFPMLTQGIGPGPTFFIFSAFCFLALLFTILIIPETKGKSFAEIQEILSR